MVNYDHPVLACAWKEDKTRPCRSAWATAAAREETPRRA